MGRQIDFPALTKALLNNRIRNCIEYLNALMVWDLMSRDDIYFLQRMGVAGWKLPRTRYIGNFAPEQSV